MLLATVVQLTPKTVMAFSTDLELDVSELSNNSSGWSGGAIAAKGNLTLGEERPSRATHRNMAEL